MKKILALICSIALVLGLFAAPAAAEAGSPLKILILTSSGVDDGNFNQDCYEGIKAFLEDHPDCTVTDVKEPDLANLVPALEGLIGEYDVFVLPGFNFSMIGDIVLANPTKYFMVVDSSITDAEGNPVTADNCYTMTYKEEQAGFLAGVAAAMSSKTGKVAVINGMAFPTNVSYEFGFMSGVTYSNKYFGTNTACVELPSYAGVDISGQNVGGNYVGSFTDVAAAKTLAENLIKEGCDVLFAAAGDSGNGVITAVKEAEGIWFVGCDVDQYDVGVKGDGNIVLTSALKNMHLSVQRALTAIYDGTFKGEDAVLGADTDSMGYVSAEGRQQLSEEALAKLQECYEKLKSGEIVPASCNGYTPTEFPGL